MSIQTTFKTLPLLLLSAAGLVACGGGGGGGGGSTSGGSSVNDFDITRMLAETADEVIIPGYNALATQATVFAADNGALDAYCNAIDGAEEATTLAAAQTAWRDLMAQWQQVEIHRLGPVLENRAVLADRISSTYTYDSVNARSNAPLSACSVDQAVLLAQDNSFNIDVRSFNERGLEAVEYILFNTNLDTACPVAVLPDADWNDLTESDRKQQRCEYAQVAAADIAAAATEIDDAWADNSGNYRSTFINDASGSLEALTDGLFYLDPIVKDLKLGATLGINDDCDTGNLSCPELVESSFSENSLANVRNNLIGFMQMLDHDGLDLTALITAAGVPEVASSLSGRAQTAIDLIDNISTSLLDQATAIDTNEEAAECTNASANRTASANFPACQLQGLVDNITDELEIDFVAAVNVDIPDRAQSDND